MKDKVDNELRKAAAESIGLDESRESALLDELEIAEASDGSIKIVASDRATFDLILRSTNRHLTGPDLGVAIQHYVEEDPEHRDTGHGWPHFEPPVAPEPFLRELDTETIYCPREIPETVQSLRSVNATRDRWRAANPQWEDADRRHCIQPEDANVADGNELFMSMDEAFQTVRTSLPPPHTEIRDRRRSSIWKLGVAAAMLGAIGVTWLVARMVQRDTGVDNVVPAMMMQPVVNPDTNVLPLQGSVLSDGATSDRAERSVDGRHEDSEKPAASPDRPEKNVSTRSSQPLSEKMTVSAETARMEESTVTGGESVVSEADASPSPQARSLIPELPSREDISRAMGEIAPDVRNCRIDASGRLVVELVVSGKTGQVISSQTVDDTFRGTTTGRCAARIAGTTQFPIFEKEKLVIKYPFDL